jgi:ribokinase
MDIVVQSPRLPAAGETILGGRFFTAPGGKGANQAVAAARLGAHVTFIGRVGDDSYGAQLTESLSQASIDVAYLGRDPEAATGVALITVDDQGQNTIVVASGANHRLTVGDIEQASTEIASAGIVVAQLENPEETLLATIDSCRRFGVPLLLNPAPARFLSGEIIAATTIITPNEIEAETLTSIQVNGKESAERAARCLLQQGAGVVVITMGVKGALLVDAQGAEYLPPWPVRAVDSTAAGDAFSGAMAVGLARGENTRQAARFASAVAALSVTRPGAQPSMPSQAEVDSFLRHHRAIIS